MTVFVCVCVGGWGTSSFSLSLSRPVCFDLSHTHTHTHITVQIGVLLTHGNLKHSVSNLQQAWRWTQNDYVLNFLPLHHVHGVINVLLCSLASGATCEMVPRFNAAAVFDRLCSSSSAMPTNFMAVPTMYSRLIAEHGHRSPEQQQTFSRACEAVDLMVSGSAALPDPVMEKYAILPHIPHPKFFRCC